MSVVRNPSRQLAAPTKLCLFIIEKKIIMLENISSEVRSATASGIYGIHAVYSIFCLSFPLSVHDKLVNFEFIE